MKQTLVLLIAAALLITGCTSDKKMAPKEGRIAVSTVLRPEIEKAAAKSPVQLAGAEAVSLWPQVGTTGQNVMPRVKTNGTLKQIWSRNIGDDLDSNRWTMAEPVSADGIVYVLDADFNLSAVRLSNGDKLWKTDLPLKNPTSVRTVGLAYSYDKLFSVSGNGTIVCTDLSGKVVWNKDLKSAMRSAPTIYRNVLYLLTADNQLILMNTDNGAEIWRYKGMPVQTNLLGMGTPAMFKNYAVVPFSNGEVITFNMNDKTVVWSDYLSAARTFNRISDLTHILASPVIENGVVYLIGNANKMGAYNLTDGQELWTLPMGGNSTPAISGNTLFVINNQNILTALDKKTGKLFWNTPLSSHEDKGAVAWKGPLLAGNEAIVVSSKGDILFIDLTKGTVTRTIQTDGITVSPIGVDGTVLFLTNEADLMAYK